MLSSRGEKKNEKVLVMLKFDWLIETGWGETINSALFLPMFHVPGSNGLCLPAVFSFDLPSMNCHYSPFL